MLRLSKKPSREEVLSFLAHATSYGNLGLFIGAGFSKAVLNESAEDDIALSWGDLLEKAAKKMDVKYASVGKVGVSYPEIESAICKSHSAKQEVSFGASLQQLKQEIAALTSWYPTDEQRKKYSQYLEAFEPSWIPIESFFPALFQQAAYGFERVGYYVGTDDGQSWAAKKTWDRRAKELKPEIIDELRNIAKQYGYTYVKKLLATMPA